jgi:signal peptidase I
METTSAIALDHAPATGRFGTSEAGPAADAPATVRAGRRVSLQVVRRAGAAAAALAVVGGLVYLGTWPPVATVMSGSMSPTIATGDVVVLRHLGRAPRLGDIVAVTVPEAARARYGYPPEVIHRVVRIGPTGDVTTKGDARPRPDPFSVRRSAIRGEVVVTIPAAGRVLAFLTSTLGLIWLAGGALVLLVLPRLDRRREAQASEDEHAAQLKDALGAISQELAQLREQAGQRAVADGGVLEALSREARESRERLTALQELVEAERAAPAEPIAIEEPVAAPEPIAFEPEELVAEPEELVAVAPAPPAAPVFPPHTARRRKGGLVGAVGELSARHRGRLGRYR